LNKLYNLIEKRLRFDIAISVL